MSAMAWGWPLLSKKAHVFSEGLSLCRAWLFTAERGPDDCAICHKKLVAHFKPTTARRHA